MPKFYTYVTPSQDEVRVEFELPTDVFDSDDLNFREVIKVIEEKAGFSIQEEYPTIYYLDDDEVAFEY